MQSDPVNVAPSFPFKLVVPKRSHQEGHTASQDASLRSRSSKSFNQGQLLPQSARQFLAEDSNHAAALAGLDAKAPRQEANVVDSLQQAGKCNKPVSRAKGCTVCAKGSSFARLWSCGSCDQLLHERCSAELPEPLYHYCLFCPDCKREPWHRGAIILASGRAGVEGKTVDRLKAAVEKIRQAHVDKRAQAGIPGPKTYAGLRGDTVTFRDLFTKMTSPGKHYGFQLEPTPDSATLSRSQTSWRLDIGWGQPVNLLCQKTSVDQVHVADAPVEHAESSRAAIHVDHPDSSLDAQTSTTGTTCSQPAAAASSVAKQSSHDSQVSTCKPGPCSTGLPHQSGRGHMRGRPNSSQRGPLGLGSATPLEDRAVLGMLKSKAKAAPLQSSAIKKLKRCHDVIDLTSDSDTPVSAQPSKVFRNAPFQINWHETDTSGTKQDEAVTASALQHDFLDDDAGTDKEDNMPLQHLAELTSDRQVMRKCMVGQLQRLKQHDSRLAPIFCARLSDVVADGGSADDLIARMYSGFQQILPYQSELSEAEQVNDVGNFFRAFLELEPVFVLEG